MAFAKLQRRERWLAGIIALLVALWLADAVVLRPLLGWLAAVDKETRELTRSAAEARILLERKDRILADWRGQHAAGLGDDEATLRFRLQQVLADAAKASGCGIDNLGSGQRVPAGDGQHYDTVRFTLNALGTLAQVTGFLGRLGDAPVPLKIERCELSARDARKDQLDLGLTLSSRLLSAKARTGRGVPEGTAPWTGESSGSLSQAMIVDSRPFSSDRRRGSGPAIASTTTAAAGTWAVVGIVQGAETIAFVRHLGDGREQTVKTGAVIDGWTIAAISGSTVDWHQGELVKSIPVGTDLDGSAVPAASRVAAPAAPATATAPAASGSATAATPTPFAVPVIPTGDASRDAILQRLRERRNRGN